MAYFGGGNGRPQGCSRCSHRLRRLKPLTPTASPTFRAAIPFKLTYCTSDVNRRVHKIAETTRSLAPAIETRSASARNHILWVDDRPENNAFERQAFEAL